MGWKGEFFRGVLRKCMVGMECRQTEHSLAAKTTWKEGQRYVEKKATLHGELANTTWSVGKGCVPRRFLWHA